MINIPDIVGWTPLHIACYYKRKEVILLLLKNQANLFFKNREGLYPYDLLENDPACFEAINSFLIFMQNLRDKSQNLAKNQITNCKTEDSHSNFYLNNQNINNLIKLSNTNEKILKNYKFIPKKPKFYLNFKESQSFNSRIFLNSFNEEKNDKNKTNNLTEKTVTLFSSEVKLNKLCKLKTLYNYDTNFKKTLKTRKELEFSLNLDHKPIQSEDNLTIKTPKAFPDTKILGRIKNGLINTNLKKENILKQSTVDYGKSITCSVTKEMIQNRPHFNQNKTNYNSTKIEEIMKEKYMNLKMLDSTESEDSFIIDFDISNDDLNNSNIPKKKKIKNEDRRVKTKSLINNIITTEVSIIFESFRMKKYLIMKKLC